MEPLNLLLSSSNQPSVFVVQHLRVSTDGRECLKLIGVYASREDAESAVSRLAAKPGFDGFSKIIAPHRDQDESGFYIDEFTLGEDHWTEGFVTLQ